jgi:hypothetical protein
MYAIQMQRFFSRDAVRHFEMDKSIGIVGEALRTMDVILLAAFSHGVALAVTDYRQSSVEIGTRET